MGTKTLSQDSNGLQVGGLGETTEVNHKSHKSSQNLTGLENTYIRHAASDDICTELGTLLGVVEGCVLIFMPILCVCTKFSRQFC